MSVGGSIVTTRTALTTARMTSSPRKIIKNCKMLSMRRCVMRLTIDQVAEAMELADKGVYWGNIADVFGVHRSTLMRYIRGAEMYGYSFWSQNPAP